MVYADGASRVTVGSRRFVLSQHDKHRPKSASAFFMVNVGIAQFKLLLPGDRRRIRATSLEVAKAICHALKRNLDNFVMLENATLKSIGYSKGSRRYCRIAVRPSS